MIDEVTFDSAGIYKCTLELFEDTTMTTGGPFTSSVDLSVYGKKTYTARF